MEQTLARDTQLALKSLKTAHIICDLELNVITSNEAANKFLNSNYMNSKSRNLLDQTEMYTHTDCINALQNSAIDGLPRTLIDSKLIPGEISKCDISRIGDVLLLEVTEVSDTQRVLSRERVELSRNAAILEAVNNSVLVIDFIDQTIIPNRLCEETFGDYSELRALLFNPHFNLSSFNAFLDTSISEVDMELINSMREVWNSGKSKTDLLTKTLVQGKRLIFRNISLWNYGGAPRGIIVSGTDVSELTRYKAEVENSQLQIRELLKNLNIWIAEFDESTGVAELYFPDGTRITQENFIGNLNQSKQAMIREAISELYQDGFATIVAPSEAGDRIIKTSISFANEGDPGKRKILAINSDVTEKVQFEELENRREKMAQIQKFAQGIAHDFGNISQSIQGFAKLLMHQVTTSDGLKILENLQVSANRALNVSHKISEIARIQVLEITYFDILSNLIAKKIELSNLLNDGVALSIDYEDGLNGVVYANEEQIDRIIENIIENANHAISGSGKIKIYCNEDAETGDLILKISNDGPAIPKQIADRIFMPFVTSRKEGGTGLGLYLAFEYLHSCGGKINLHNQNRDVCFEISLPRERR